MRGSGSGHTQLKPGGEGELGWAGVQPKAREPQPERLSEDLGFAQHHASDGCRDVLKGPEKASVSPSVHRGKMMTFLPQKARRGHITQQAAKAWEWGSHSSATCPPPEALPLPALLTVGIVCTLTARWGEGPGRTPRSEQGSSLTQTHMCIHAHPRGFQNCPQAAVGNPSPAPKSQERCVTANTKHNRLPVSHLAL